MQNRKEKQIMSSNTTVNWLFNDIWCYLFIACFNWKSTVFQQTVVKICYILNLCIWMFLCVLDLSVYFHLTQEIRFYFSKRYFFENKQKITVISICKCKFQFKFHFQITHFRESTISMNTELFIEIYKRNIFYWQKTQKLEYVVCCWRTFLKYFYYIVLAWWFGDVTNILPCWLFCWY